MTISTIDHARPQQRRRSWQPTVSSDRIALFAHDLRGPLTNLSLLVESIDDRARSLRDYRIGALVAKADRMIDHLESMIGAVIERARSGGDVLSVRLEKVSVPDLVEQAAALNQPLAMRRGVRVHCYVAEPLVMSGDGHLLMQALDNLLTNAIKHSPPGGLVICQAMPDAGGVVIRVEDEGPGLTDADIAAAFQPFTQLSARSDANLPSTGLGLSIVRQIARQHGGDVQASRASNGKGAAFTLRLPRRDHDVDSRINANRNPNEA